MVGRTDRLLMAYKLRDCEGASLLVQSGKWDVAGQIGSLTMVWDGAQSVLGISQPGVSCSLHWPDSIPGDPLSRAPQLPHPISFGWSALIIS